MGLSMTKKKLGGKGGERESGEGKAAGHGCGTLKRWGKGKAKETRKAVRGPPKCIGEVEKRDRDLDREKNRGTMWLPRSR